MDLKAITLSDGKKYIIANELFLDDKTYYQLLPVDKESDLVLAENDNGNILFIEDEKTQAEILKQMCKDKISNLKNN